MKKMSLVYEKVAFMNKKKATIETLNFSRAHLLSNLLKLSKINNLKVAAEGSFCFYQYQVSSVRLVRKVRGLETI